MVRSWKEGVCQSPALSPGWECLLEGPVDACAPPATAPSPALPGLAFLLWAAFPPEDAWAAQDGAEAGDRMGLLVALPRDTQPFPCGAAWQSHASPAEPALPCSHIPQIPLSCSLCFS